MLDELTRAVLNREEVSRYLDGTKGERGDDVRARIQGYLEELKTTQRYSFYKALKHPLYPILRKIDRVGEHIDLVKSTVRGSRVVYASNHRSHCDYLVELLVLDENGVRPPIIAAGINLFGGPLGLLHRHVTGAIPIRRNSRDPLYLITLKAYVAELLRKHDFFFYPEGGRSYNGELKSPKTGLMQAALQADRHELSIVPMAVAYDLVLEDRILSREAVRRRGRPFAQEIAEMARHAVGYRSRAFVTFGQPIALATFDPESRRDLVTLAHRVQDAVGLAYKVLPTALVASAMRAQISRRELGDRLDELVATLAGDGANLAVRTGQEALDDGVAMLAERGILVDGRGRIRVRDRIALRYYARTIQHLVQRRARTMH